MQHVAAIPLPAAVRVLVDLLLGTIGRGLRGLMHRYGEPDAMRGSNAGAFADLGRALAIVRRLGRIFRYVVLILALRVEAPKQRPPRMRADVIAPRRARTDAFAVTAPWCRARGEPLTPPPRFARGDVNRMETLARSIAALSRALRNTMPLVRRLAGVLVRDVVVLKWRPPKRSPAWRDDWDDLLNAFEQARFDLRTWRAWRRYADSS